MLNYQNFIQENKVRVGEILIKKGLVSEADLKQALAQQRELGKKLGEVLIEKELITQRQLTTALLEQRVKNSALSIFFITSSLLGLSQGATASEGGTGIRATLTGHIPVSVTVDMSDNIAQLPEAGNKSLQNSAENSTTQGIETNNPNQGISAEVKDGHYTIVAD